MGREFDQPSYKVLQKQILRVLKKAPEETLPITEILDALGRPQADYHTRVVVWQLIDSGKLERTDKSDFRIFKRS